jgi:PPE-repeat protein
MDFATLSPEINSARMYAGPGSGPMLAAATAWDGLAAQLHSTAAAYDSVLSGLTGWSWQGPASTSMLSAAAPYVAWMRSTAAQAEQAASQARAAAAAYHAAFTMTVPPPVVAANRSLLMTLMATNIFGQNTPAIATTEAQYAEMWAQDAAAMFGYAGSSAAASTLTPFTPPPPTTNAGGPAATAAQSILSNGPQVISAVPQALQGLASPAAVDPTSLGGLLTALSVIVTAVDLPIATASVTASTTSATGAFTSVGTTFRGLLINADRDFAEGKGPFTGNGPGGTMLPQWIIGGTGGIGAPSDAVDSSVSAGLGQATNVGKLSAPPKWATAAPAFRTVAYSLPMTGAGAAPEIVAGGSGSLFSDLALAGLAGRAVGSAAYPGRPAGRADQRVRVARGDQPKPQEPVGSGVAHEIAAELRELAAHAQSLLAKLHDSGLMSAEEITIERKRFPF